MTIHEVVALRCPSCGGGITQPSREMPFGAEFRCDHCGISSVLIIDRALVPLSTLQKQGEKICTACGRVAQREARFCQEGHTLVRACVHCHLEFAVDHQRCDYCGWPQNVKPGTTEAEALAFDRAVSDLADPTVSVDSTTVGNSLAVIKFGVGTASLASATAAASAILSLMMDPSYRRKCLVNDEGVNYTENSCLSALSALGPAARQTVPMLHQRLEKFSSEQSPNEAIEHPLLSCLVAVSPEDAVPKLRQKLEKIWPAGWGRRGVWLRMLSTISPEDALSYCRRGLEEGGKYDSEESIGSAVHAAFALGKAAIPTLEKFCGPFSGPRGRCCKAAISALRNDEKTLPPLPWAHPFL
jgi:hypothetical protein